MKKDEYRRIKRIIDNCNNSLELYEIKEIVQKKIFEIIEEESNKKDILSMTLKDFKNQYLPNSYMSFKDYKLFVRSVIYASNNFTDIFPYLTDYGYNMGYEYLAENKYRIFNILGVKDKNIFNKNMSFFFKEKILEKVEIKLNELGISIFDSLTKDKLDEIKNIIALEEEKDSILKLDK